MTPKSSSSLSPWPGSSIRRLPAFGPVRRKSLIGSSRRSESTDTSSSNWDLGCVAEEEANREFQRALVGCYWDEVGYLTRGYCSVAQPS